MPPELGDRLLARPEPDDAPAVLLLERVWGYDYAGGTRTVDVHVAQLRRKLGDPESIRTVRGAGYKLQAA